MSELMMKCELNDSGFPKGKYQTRDGMKVWCCVYHCEKYLEDLKSIKNSKISKNQI